MRELVPVNTRQKYPDALLTRSVAEVDTGAISKWEWERGFMHPVRRLYLDKS